MGSSEEETEVYYFHKELPKRNYLATGILSFLLGVLVTFMATDSLFGTSPTNILDNKFTTKSDKMSQSERLIAQGSVIDVARRVRPSVVNVQTRQMTGGIRNQSVDGVGSGIIIREDGYILTNEHVVANAKSILVSVKSEKREANIVGEDKEADIAVIKINSPTKLPVPQFASAQTLKVGELAVAIGSPFGFQRSVTAGVVSALNRNVTVNDDLEKPKTYANLIQTDAAINPGNSGGALSNRRGEVVGVNSLIYSTTGVSQGIGFAIPIDLAKKIAFQIIKDGRPKYSFLGVLGQSITPDMTDRQKLPVNQGVLIEKVLAGSPAQAVGLVQGDIVMGLGDKQVNSMDDLVGDVNAQDIGARVNLFFLRRGERRQVSVTLAERPNKLSN